MRRKLFAAVLAIVAATAGLTACGSSDDPNVLKVGTEGTYSPFSFQKDGQLTGFDVEVITAVGDKLGRRVEFVQTPWDAIFAGLESTRVDLVANQVSSTPERAEKYSLSQRYARAEGVIVTRADNTGITSLADLDGKTCAQSITSNWSEVASGAGCEVEGVEGFVQAIQLLGNGRVDATVNDSLAVGDYTKQHGSADVTVTGKTGATSDQVFAARKDSQALIDQVNKALDELRADGTLARISEKYFGDDVTE